MAIYIVEVNCENNSVESGGENINYFTTPTIKHHVCFCAEIKGMGNYGIVKKEEWCLTILLTWYHASNTC